MSLQELKRTACVFTSHKSTLEAFGWLAQAIGGQVAPVNKRIPAGVPRQHGASRKFLNAPIEKTLLLGIKTLHTDP